MLQLVINLLLVLAQLVFSNNNILFSNKMAAPFLSPLGVVIFLSHFETFARFIFSAPTALKTIKKYSFTPCKLRFIDRFCLAGTKTISRAKVSFY